MIDQSHRTESGQERWKDLVISITSTPFLNSLCLLLWDWPKIPVYFPLEDFNQRHKGNRCFETLYFKENLSLANTTKNQRFCLFSWSWTSFSEFYFEWNGGRWYVRQLKSLLCCPAVSKYTNIYLIVMRASELKNPPNERRAGSYLSFFRFFLFRHSLDEILKGLRIVFISVRSRGK